MKKAFSLAMEIDEASKLIESLKKTLRDIVKQFDWDNQNDLSKLEISSEIKRKINLCFDKNWSKELAESSKGEKETRNYVHIKNSNKI